MFCAFYVALARFKQLESGLFVVWKLGIFVTSSHVHLQICGIHIVDVSGAK